jgi:L-gulono-1,4-lactone dehydrogenase
MSSKRSMRSTRRAALVFAALTTTGATCATYSWHNFSNTQQVSPAYMAVPKSIDDLVKAVKMAGDDGRRIRMTGSGHSHSDVAVTDDILLTPTGLTAPLALARGRLKDHNAFGLVRVQSGITLRALDTYLDTQSLALQNMGGYDAQTIVGAAMTGTHGSGLGYGPIASQIVSMQVVGEGGVVYQIEPTGGITNPVGFPGTQEENPLVPVTLIQDDDVFDAMTVSLGSMGIVYAVVLQTDHKFWLDERRTLTTWSEVRKPGGVLDRIMQGLPIDDSAHPPEHYELQYNPYAVNGEHSMLLTTRTRYYDKPVGGDTTRGQPLTDALQGLVVGTSFVIAGIVNTLPDTVPGLIETALQAQVDDNGYVSDSYNVFNIGKVNETKALAVEIGFDLADARAVIDRAFQLADELRVKHLMHSAPASIRFVGPSRSMISMAQGRPTVVLELIVLQDVNNYQELLRTYEQTLMEEFGGRLHWGLDLDVIQGDTWPRAVYPRWDAWLAVYKQFNHGSFDGAVTDRLGISIKPHP